MLGKIKHFLPVMLTYGAVGSYLDYIFMVCVLHPATCCCCPTPGGTNLWKHFPGTSCRLSSQEKGSLSLEPRGSRALALSSCPGSDLSRESGGQVGRGLPTDALLHRWGKGQLPSLRGPKSSSLFSVGSKPEHIGICSVAVRWGALKCSISWLKAGSYAL